MKTKSVLRTTFTLVLVFLIGIAIASGQSTRGTANPAQAPPQVQYMVIDLGEDGVGNGITDSGRIVGSHNFGDVDRHPTFWPNIHGLPIDLGILPDGFGGRGFGINPQGQMVGYDFPADFSFSRPLFWANSHSSPIELPGLPVGFSVAADINSAGNIVGGFVALDESGAWGVFWRNSTTDATCLPQVSDQLPFSVAFTINASGNILGDACDPNSLECYLAYWPSSTSTPVTLTSPGGDFIYTDVGFSSGYALAHALNNAGSMVGFAYNADYSQLRAVYWASSASLAVTLSTSDDFQNGTAEAINDRGQIVGTAYNSDFSDVHAFFWPSPTGPGIDLNSVIPAGSGLELAVARAINNRGEITGAAYPNGQPPAHAVVLIPVPGR